MTTASHGLDLRPITDDELPGFLAAEHQGFGEDVADGAADRFRAVMPFERTLAAFDGDDVVATLGEYDMRLTVPGGATVPMAGLTMVTVRPTHRRRGVLRSMMDIHLQRSADRGDAVAALWASEAPIYGRFGYGLASERHSVTFDHRLVDFAPPADDTEVVQLSADEVERQVVPRWPAIGADRAGWLPRSDARWAAMLADPADYRGGATALRHIVARRDGVVVGHVCFRQRSKWNDAVPTGEIDVRDLAAADVDAGRALWRYVASIDLFPFVKAWNVAVDDPLAAESSNEREVVRRVSDGLHVRVLDTKAALEARTYETDGTAVIEVADALGHASGRWQLTIDGGQATATPTTAAPDLALDVRELGALYLGRDVSELLARTSRLHGDATVVRRAARLFVTARAPWCPEMF